VSNDPILKQQKERLKKTSMAVDTAAKEVLDECAKMPEPSALDRLAKAVVAKLKTAPATARIGGPSPA
jgi:hypothetical protein